MKNIKSTLVVHYKITIWSSVILLFLIVSGWYILVNAEPALGSYIVSRGNIISTVDLPGTVSSSNSVDLSFQESGQINRVYVREGQSVSAGQALASLDTSAQETALSQDEAALSIQEANLASLQEGTRPEQIAVTQAQVQSDQTALTQANNSVTNAIQNAYTTADTAVVNDVNQFVNNSQTILPTISFQASNAQLQNNFIVEYTQFETVLTKWQTDITNTTDLSSLESESQANLNLITQLTSDANTLLNDATAGKDISQTSLNTWITNITTVRANINTVSTALTAAITIQQNAAANLNKDQKNLLLQEASSTASSIDAQQAAIAQVQAQIENAKLVIDHATIIAPFSGIVRNVTAEPGMVVSTNVPVLSIINNGILKIDAYASGTDVPTIQSNATTTVTLDAYGDSTEFTARVSAIDTAATIINGEPAYHVTIYFTQPDSRIRAGMPGNVTIVNAEHDNVIEIPARLVLGSNGKNFVLIHKNKNPITEGLIGNDGMIEITSGLTAGQQISNY